MKLLQWWMIAAVLCFSVPVREAGAAATVTVVQSSEGVYSVSVANVANAAAIDFQINYDADALSNPVVNDSELIAEAAAYRELNTVKPGLLRVIYLSASGFKKSGKLATVVFTKKGSLPARPPKLESSVYSSAGAQTAVQPVVSKSAETNVGTDSAVTYSGGTSRNQVNQNADNMGNLPSRPSATTSISSDSISNQAPLSGVIQDNRSQRNENLPEPTPETPYKQAQSAASAVEQEATLTTAANGVGKIEPNTTAEAVLKNLKTFESVAERFRTYRGARTLKGFSALFDFSKSKAAGFVQTPEIAVSDGKKLINIKVSLPQTSGVPSFSLKGANLKGIKNLSDKLLELDVLPQKGKLDVRISIVIQKEEVEIPLLVVPPVAAGFLELSDSDLEKQLSNPNLKNKVPPYDLNADGKQDYLDDYVLVAHWLLKQQSDKKIPAAKSSAPR